MTLYFFKIKGHVGEAISRAEARDLFGYLIRKRGEAREPPL
jgi:hypothetical protein